MPAVGPEPLREVVERLTFRLYCVIEHAYDLREADQLGPGFVQLARAAREYMLLTYDLDP